MVMWRNKYLRIINNKVWTKAYETQNGYNEINVKKVKMVTLGCIVWMERFDCLSN